MAKKICFKALKLLTFYIRWIMVFLGALTLSSIYFHGDVHALFGAVLFTAAIWAVEAYIS